MAGHPIRHHPQGMLLSVRACSHGTYTSRFQHALQTSQERGLEGYPAVTADLPFGFHQCIHIWRHSSALGHSSTAANTHRGHHLCTVTSPTHFGQVCKYAGTQAASVQCRCHMGLPFTRMCSGLAGMRAEASAACVSQARSSSPRAPLSRA